MDNPRWKFVGVYSDYGLSGTGTADRIGFRRLIRHCKEGKIDRILCKSISRFARNTADFSRTMLLLRSWHVTILFEKENLDSAEMQNEFILSVLGAFAQEESRSISSNVKDGIRMNMSQGNVPNAAMYGYRYTGNWLCAENGYEYREVEIVPEEANVIQTIFEKTADDRSFAEIARALNAQGISAPNSNYNKVRKKYSRKGQLNSDLDDGWKASQIAKLVRNERYVGDVLTQKTFISDYLTHKVKINKGELHQYYIKDHHPAIVDRELYEKVQYILEKRRKKQSGYDRKAESPFANRIVCGECGRFYCGIVKEGKRIWRCPTVNRTNGLHLCHAENIAEETIVFVVCKAIFKDYGLDHALLFENQETETKEPNTLEKHGRKKIQILFRSVRQRMEKILNDDYVERDRSLYKGQLAEMDEALEQIASEIVRLENRMPAVQEHLQEELPAGNEELEVLRKKRRAKERRSQEITRKLDELEEYWKELECDYELRAEALQWIKGLPQNKNGLKDFLQGVTGRYFKAFVLDMTVSSQKNDKIRWFDNRCTEVDRKAYAEEDKADG